MTSKAKSTPEQEACNHKPTVTRWDLRARYPELMALSPEERDELVARVLVIMVRRGECKPLSKVTGRLITKGNEKERYLSYLKELELQNVNNGNNEQQI